MSRSSLRPYVWMLVGSFAFSWMAIFAHLAGRGVPWQAIAVVRSFLPLLIVVIWLKLDGGQLVFRGTPVLWMRSVAGSISLVGYFYALTRMPPADVYTLSNIFPIWVALLCWPMLGRVPSAAVWVSVVSGVLGVFLIQPPQTLGENPAALVVIGMTLFTALAMMGLHQLKHLDPRAVVAHFSGVSCVFSLSALAFLGSRPTEEPFALRHALLLAGVGVTATAGQFFLTKAFTSGEPAKLSVVGLTQVLFVLLLDLVFIGHPLDGYKLLGIPLIVVPTAWLMLRRQRRAPRPMVTPALEPAPSAAE